MDISVNRYKKNCSSINVDEQFQLSLKKACVLGCGGLGGYVAELLARVGVGFITAIDGDMFEASNLNRQLFCNESNIGKSKALEAKKRIEQINSEISVNAVSEYLTAENAKVLLSGHDIVIDALDSIEIRLLLQKTCAALSIPLIHGSIAGWYGQVATIMPGQNTLNILYKNAGNKGIEETIGNLGFTAAAVASFQAAEAVKLLTEKGEPLPFGFLRIDLLSGEAEFIGLSPDT